MKLSICTWNIGCAALGRDADFVIDGGKSFFASNKKQVERYLEGILKQLTVMIEEHDVDVFFIQEVSRKSPASIFIDVRGAVEELLEKHGYQMQYDSVFSIFGWFFQHGQLIAYKAKHNNVKTVTLSPFERIWIFWQLLRKLTLVEIPKYNLILGNIHTTGHEKINLETQRQVKNILSEVAQMRMKYDHVLIGGDWNMNFPNTKHKYGERSYVASGDEELVNPAGMQFVTAEYPTIRSLDKPYDRTNKIGNIDGFLLSSRMHLKSTIPVDQDFENSDHEPVLAIVELQ